MTINKFRNWGKEFLFQKKNFFGNGGEKGEERSIDIQSFNLVQK